MINTKLTQTDNPPIEELQSISKTFQNEYNICRKKCNGATRRFILLKKNGEHGKYYGHFNTLHKMLQNFPDVAPINFIRAQFYFRGLIQPFEVFDNKAMQYYINFMDKVVEKYGVKELKQALLNDYEYMQQQCSSWNIKFSLSNYFQYKNEGALMTKASLLIMTMAMPSQLFLSNSETYKQSLQLLPRDIRQDLPQINDDDMQKQRSQYINHKELLQYFKTKFTKKESII